VIFNVFIYLLVIFRCFRWIFICF